MISVTERQSYILRVRDLAKACCGAWLATEGGGGHDALYVGSSEAQTQHLVADLACVGSSLSLDPT